MSNPPGPPPPYGYTGYPGGPPGVAYVTTPVVMPIYPPPPHMPQPEPSQPTYVTNHYYPQNPHQPQQMPPVYQPVEDAVDWVSATTATAATFTHRAFVAGKEGWDSSPLWVIRAHHNGEFIPGKLAIRHRAAYIPHAGKEIPVHHFEILLAKPHAVRWLPSNNGQVPVGAIAAGNTHGGEPLYICRAHYKSSITPGKVHPSHQCAYISFGGQEVSLKNYEVLCRVVG